MRGRRLSPRVTAAVALAAIALAGAARAQTLSTSAAQFNAGYGRAAGQENMPTSYAGGAGQLGVDTTMSWTQGSTTLVLTGAGASASAGGFAAASIGGGLSVITQQGTTTTVVNLGASASAQAQASAQIELNGAIDLDGPH